MSWRRILVLGVSTLLTGLLGFYVVQRLEMTKIVEYLSLERAGVAALALPLYGLALLLRGVRVAMTREDDRMIFHLDITQGAADPATNLEGTVRFYRPDKAQALAEGTMQATETPGRYTVMLEAPASGLIDLKIDAENGEQVLYTTLRKAL